VNAGTPLPTSLNLQIPYGGDRLFEIYLTYADINTQQPITYFGSVRADIESADTPLLIRVSLVTTPLAL
jgi:hypothetical protein